MRSLFLLLFALCPGLILIAQDPCDELLIDFTYSDHPDGLQFTDGSTYPGVVTWYQWTFGDGNFSFAQNPIHGFDTNGTYEVCLTIGVTVETGDGTVQCLDTVCQLVEYTAGGGFSCSQYSASFGSEVIEGNTVMFYSTTEPVGGEHLWQFGDGNSGSGNQVTHTFDGPGEYNVCLTSYLWSSVSQQYCISNACSAISVGDTLNCDNLVASFVGTLQGGTTLLFEQTTSPTANSFNWDLGDNTTATGPVVSHTYTLPGTYQVCMGAYWWNDLSPDSCFEYHCEIFHVLDTVGCDTDLNATFGWSHVDGLASFQANSGGVATGYIWDFGDGSSGEGASVQHQYLAEGEYELCLSAWYVPSADPDTCWTTSCDTIMIGPGSTSCAELEVAFMYESLASGVQFTGLSAVPGVPVSVEWNFGDGSSSDQEDPLHMYADPGEYEVCLTIQSLIGDPADPDTCTATECMLVNWVGGADPCVGLEIAFIGSPIGPLEILFHNTSEPAPGGSFWEFGDGSTATGDQVEHIYGGAGTYQVCLTNWWWNEMEQDTCWSTLCENFEVSDEVLDCDPDLAIDFTWQQQGNAFTFTSTVNFTAEGVIWDFGDGTNGLGETIAHLYQPPGPYLVCANAWYWNESTQDSCWASVCQEVFFNSGDCDPTFSVSISAEPIGNQVTFTANPSIEADGHIWDFGDGTIGTGTTVTHLFEPPGPYDVCVNSWYWEPQSEDSCWAVACIAVDPYVGIGESAASEFWIHPNPATDHLTIDAGSGTPLPDRIKLHSADGRLVFRDRTISWPYRMDVSDLAPGLFILQMIYADQILLHRVMIE